MKKIALSVLALSSIAYINDANAITDQETTRQIVENSMSDKEVSLGVSAGTTGFTGEIGFRNRKATTRLGRHVGFRFNYNKFDGELNDIDVDGTEFEEIGIDTQSKGAIMDLYLFNETWLLRNMRFSAGYYWGDFNLSAVATAASVVGDVNVGGTNYTLGAGDYVSSVIDYDLTGPYIGAGYQAELLLGLGLTIDAGVIMVDNDSTNVTLDTNVGAISAANLAQEEANLEEELPEDFYPVVRIGVSYTF